MKKSIKERNPESHLSQSYGQKKRPARSSSFQVWLVGTRALSRFDPTGQISLMVVQGGDDSHLVLNPPQLSPPVTRDSLDDLGVERGKLRRGNGVNGKREGKEEVEETLDL